MKYYTGIGSRTTPEKVCLSMTKIAEQMHAEGYTLRSGGAMGADSAFEKGAGTQKEIYIPWNHFNRRNKSDKGIYELFDMPRGLVIRSADLVREVHPIFDKLKPGAQKLHMRNVFQVLGQDLNTPSDHLVCWTEGGKDIGGTRTAIMLARKFDIPIRNLFHDDSK